MPVPERANSSSSPSMPRLLFVQDSYRVASASKRARVPKFAISNLPAGEESDARHIVEPIHDADKRSVAFHRDLQE